MKRWIAIVIVVGVVGGLAIRRGGGASNSHESSATHPRQDRAPRLSVAMPSPNTEPVGNLRLGGRVVGPDGRGIAGAVIQIDSVPQRTTTSASEGAFEFEGLLSRTYEVRAKA